ncbi:hypothetical protein E2P81_ATG03492 [Venturia nashicola]|nr:hypothetical protein E2P81_ATG03492 [Venturia nashicola]
MASMVWNEEAPPEVPHIGEHDSFPDLLRKLSLYFVDVIHSPHSFEDFRMVTRGKPLWPLINYLSDCVHNQTILHALLALKSHFAALDPDDDRGLNLTRGYACEYVAWRFVTHLSGREAIDFLLFELPPAAFSAPPNDDVEASLQFSREAATESSALLNHSEHPYPQGTGLEDTPVNADNDARGAKAEEENDEFASSFQNLNALEIAAVSDAKKFLSQRVVQRIIESIWRGEIIFWETLGVDSVKDAKVYNKKKADPFSRLRVPLYNKVFEAIFFLSFLALYYAVLVPIQRSGNNRPRRPGVPPLSADGALHSTESERLHSFRSITTNEVLLYIWILSFAYDEFGDFMDAGQAFYSTDFWSIWDIGIVLIGVIFFVTRMVGLAKGSDDIIGIAFDILALEALFLVPRSHVYEKWCVHRDPASLWAATDTAQTKDFVKFLSLVTILYLGFLTTFTLLARDNFTLREMSWILVKVFFGSSYLGFDVAQDISPALVNLRLPDKHPSYYIPHIVTIELFDEDPRQCTNRISVHNLLPLLLRPLRLCIPPEQLRRTRILLLKITHSPFVAAIWVYEGIQERLYNQHRPRGSGISSLGGPASSASLKRASYLKSQSYYTPRTLVASQASLPRAAHASRSSASLNQRPPTRNSNDALEAMVLKLTCQVEELTAMVAGQQEEHAKTGPVKVRTRFQVRIAQISPLGGPSLTGAGWIEIVMHQDSFHVLKRDQMWAHIGGGVSGSGLSSSNIQHESLSVT